MENCPYCGFDEYYTKDRVYGTARFIRRFDGEEADNSEMFDYIIQKPGKVAYCQNCHRKIGNCDHNGVIKNG